MLISAIRFISRRSGRHWRPAVLLMSIFACSPSPPPPGVVATTDLGELSQADLESYLLSLEESRRSPGTDESLSEWKKRVLEEMIVAKALEAEARTKGLDATSDGITVLESRSETILIQTMSSRMIGERVNVTEDDLRAFYDAHPEEFSHPDQIRLRNIYRRVSRDAPPEEWAEAREEMDGLIKAIHSGAQFNDLARAHSDSETAPLGGLIGRLDRGKLDPALEAKLWSLGEGEVSDVIRTPVGYQIFKVEDYVGDFKMDFEDARTRLHRRLVREATEKAETEILEELVRESGAVYRPEALDGGDLEEEVFSFEGESMTVADFYARIETLGFHGAREFPPREHLGRMVRDRLFLWRAIDTRLGEEPDVAAKLDEAERDALIGMARQERWMAAVDEAGEDELRELFLSKQNRYQSPQLVRLSILTMDFPDDKNWYKVYEEIQGVADDIRSGRRDFADAARELSTDFTSIRGGDVGAIRLQAVAEWGGPQAQHRIKELAVGEVSAPILVERYNSNQLTYERAGYMIVRLEELIVSQPLSFEKAREKVVGEYMEQAGAEIRQRIRSDVLRSVDTTIYEENL